MDLRIVTRQSCEKFRPVPPFFVIRRLPGRLRGTCSSRHDTSSKQQQSQPNIFAVTVIVVVLGRSYSFPASS